MIYGQEAAGIKQINRRAPLAKVTAPLVGKHVLKCVGKKNLLHFGC